MEFDKSKVYTALNADEVKVGSKGCFADNIDRLKEIVENEIRPFPDVLKKINAGYDIERFMNKNGTSYVLFYLIEEPKEEKYRPYESTDEMIEDFKERIKAYGAAPFRCPMFMQNIWVMDKLKSDKKYLITGFENDNVGLSNDYSFWDFESLFKEFIYLDGTPCGKLEIKK